MKKAENQDKKSPKVHVAGWLNIKSDDYASRGASFQIANQSEFEISIRLNDYMKYYVQLRDKEMILFLNEENAKNNIIEDKILLTDVKGVDIKTNRLFGTTKENRKRSKIVITYNSNEKNKIKIQVDQKEDQDLWYKYLYAAGMLGLFDVEDKKITRRMTDLNLANPAPTLPPYTRRLSTDKLINTPSRSTRRHSLQSDGPYVKSELTKTHENHNEDEEVFVNMKGAALPFKCSRNHLTLPLPRTPSTSISTYSPSPPPSDEDEYTVMSPLTTDPLTSFPSEFLSQPADEKDKDTAKTKMDKLDEEQTIPSLSSSKRPWFIEQPTTPQEAEALLLRVQESGNMIVRRRKESKDHWEFAVTIGPLLNGKVFRHIRLRKETNGSEPEYKIMCSDQNPPVFYTLEDVLDYFTKKSSGIYKPVQAEALEVT